MKIINQRIGKKKMTLHAAKFGSVVQFTKQFNSEYPPEELFIVLCVCDTYFPTKYGMSRDKQGVACLANGGLSYVDTTREVTVMAAEVTVNGPKED